MVRKIDEKKTRRALRRLERARKAAAASDADKPDLSDWEGEFLGSLEERLEKFGSAFNDPDKGNTEDALSSRQALKLREIENKAKGKARKPMSRGHGFKRKSGSPVPRGRDIYDDLDGPADPAPRPADPVRDHQPPDAPEARRASFRVIPGGGGSDVGD
ncbi:hypothetical protein [Maricaulis maris]|uniref:hypothetical protein n=1 Tax=Maricaulis maris TaxID=74318 RepID=UPI00291E68BB|nr:hypothetical protein MACH15_25210 [Maricaulis maris]